MVLDWCFFVSSFTGDQRCDFLSTRSNAVAALFVQTSAALSDALATIGLELIIGFMTMDKFHAVLHLNCCGVEIMRKTFLLHSFCTALYLPCSGFCLRGWWLMLRVD